MEHDRIAVDISEPKTSLWQQRESRGERESERVSENGDTARGGGLNEQL